MKDSTPPLAATVLLPGQKVLSIVDGAVQVPGDAAAAASGNDSSSSSTCTPCLQELLPCCVTSERRQVTLQATGTGLLSPGVTVLARSQGMYLPASASAAAGQREAAECVGSANATGDMPTGLPSAAGVLVHIQQLQPYGLVYVEFQQGQLVSEGKPLLVVDEPQVAAELEALQQHVAVGGCKQVEAERVLIDLGRLLDFRAVAERHWHQVLQTSGQTAAHSDVHDAAVFDEVQSIKHEVWEAPVMAAFPTSAFTTLPNHDGNQQQREEQEEPGVESSKEYSRVETSTLDSGGSSVCSSRRLALIESSDAQPQRLPSSPSGTSAGRSILHGVLLDSATAAAVSNAATAAQQADGGRASDFVVWNSSSSPRPLLRSLSTPLAMATHVLCCQFGLSSFEKACSLDSHFLQRGTDVGVALLSYCVDRGWPATCQMVLDVLLAHAALVCSFAAVAAAVADRDGLGLLHRAVRSGSCSMVLTVLRWGEKHSCCFPWDAAGPLGLTPLHLAALLDCSSNSTDRCTAGQDSTCSSSIGSQADIAAFIMRNVPGSEDAGSAAACQNMAVLAGSMASDDSPACSSLTAAKDASVVATGGSGRLDDSPGVDNCCSQASQIAALFLSTLQQRLLAQPALLSATTVGLEAFNVGWLLLMMVSLVAGSSLLLLLALLGMVVTGMLQRLVAVLVQPGLLGQLADAALLELQLADLARCARVPLMRPHSKLTLTFKDRRLEMQYCQALADARTAMDALVSAIVKAIVIFTPVLPRVDSFLPASWAGPTSCWALPVSQQIAGAATAALPLCTQLLGPGCYCAVRDAVLAAGQALLLAVLRQALLLIPGLRVTYLPALNAAICVLLSNWGGGWSMSVLSDGAGGSVGAGQFAARGLVQYLLMPVCVLPLIYLREQIDRNMFLASVSRDPHQLVRPKAKCT
eukprot:gene7109-7323_t